jgi:hypothetical protein
VDARHKAGHVSHNISAMTDISANIFALLILILIIMLAARENSPTPRVQGPQVIDVEKDVAGVERSPLSSEEVIELLYERRERASSTKIDLLERKDRALRHDRKCRFTVKTDCFRGFARWRLRSVIAFIARYPTA